MTERLYWTNPRALTATATVTGHYAGGFLLDKTIFHAPLASYHHAQPCDIGHALADGHKLKIHKVAWQSGRTAADRAGAARRVGEDQAARGPERGVMVHRTDGPLPSIGARAILHLDPDRRMRQARAHAAMHLLITAAAESYATFTDDPCVVGGGEARLTAKFREKPEIVVPKVVARAQQLAEAREEIVAKWAPREDVAKMQSHEPVALDAIAPGEPTLRIVQCGKRSLIPCDAPLPQHTWEVGQLKLAMLQRKGESVRFGVKVA